MAYQNPQQNPGRTEPRDSAPAVYGQPQYAPPQQGYVQPPYGAPQPPVVVNVTQNASGGVAMIKPINHFLHWVLILFTGGLWLFVYVPLLMKRRKVVVYR